MGEQDVSGEGSCSCGRAGERAFATRCVHGPAQRSYVDGLKAVSQPIYQTATFAHIRLGKSTGFDYTREKNPTRTHLEETMASLEGAARATAFSSGMAAVTACFDLLAPGDHVICSDDLYGGVTRLIKVVASKNGVVVEPADTSDLASVEALITPATKALYVETPTNPMMHVTDLRAAAELAHAHGMLLIVDNTFLSPYFQNPLALGADLVIHSGTKFLAGHNDTIAGFVCCASAEMGDHMDLLAKTVGSNLAPFDCWLVERGIKTLAVRMERQEANARRVAAWLVDNPQVEHVYYVGLPDHPGYEVNARQARGCGSMISFRTRDVETAERVLDDVKLVTFAESLGGTESLITYPMTQTHPDVPPEVRERLGITATLLRLSVGLEDADDIIADLAQAFGAAK